jgi:hypothetical protein
LNGDDRLIDKVHSACTLTFLRDRPNRSYATIPSILEKIV